MKIAIFGTRGIPARYGGFETCAEELSVGLARKGHKISVYCRYNNLPTNPKKYKGVSLKYISHINTKNFGTFSHTLLSLIHALFKRYDFLLVFNVGVAPLCLIPKLFGKKVIINVDGLEWKRKKWGFWVKRYFQFCESIVSLVADAVITDSKAIRNYYLDQYGIKTHYIAYGTYFSRSSSPKILKEYGIEKDEYFFTASRLEPENNAALTVKAFHKVKTSKKLLIVGGANYSSKYIDMLNNTKDKRIKLLGPIYDPQHIKELHCNCFAYIHGNEVGGTNPALLKAMGYGNCILALDVSYNAEVVRDTAILYKKNVNDLKNKINYLLDNPQKAKMLGRKAALRAKKFYPWRKVIGEYEKLFEGLWLKRIESP